MNFAIFARPVVTIYDLTETTKESDAGVVSTIGDEGLYGQVCQVRTAPGGVTAEGVTLPEEMAEVVSFYGYHGYVFASELQFCGEAELRSYLAAEWVMAGRATDVLTLPKVQGVRLLELERGALLRRFPVIEVTMTGFCMRMDAPARGLSPGRLFWLAAAGPAVNFMLAGIWALRLEQELTIRGSAFWAANLLTGGFNLLPVPPLDGAQLASCLCEMRRAGKKFKGND